MHGLRIDRRARAGARGLPGFAGLAGVAGVAAAWLMGAGPAAAAPERVAERHFAVQAAVPEDVWHLPAHTRADRFLPVEFDVPGLAAELRAAPMEAPAAALGAEAAVPPGVVIDLPTPDGVVRSYRVVETSVLHPDLAARFPEIKTYIGRAVDDATEEAALTVGPLGLSVQVRSPASWWMIDPLSVGDAVRHGVYWAEDAGPAPLACTATGEPVPVNAPAQREAARAGDVSAQLVTGPVQTTYRLAVATTGEFSARFGGTVSNSLNQVAAIVNRVNQIWRAELSAQFQLVASNNSLIYTNSATDPYTNSSNETMLDENQANLTTVIGLSNFDIGHVLGTAGGGVAQLGVACTASKARGVSANNFSGTFVSAQTMAHELGHQYNAPHTFNSPEASTCGPQRSTTTPYEPGSGSTIMSYGGSCGADNIGARSDYYHSISLDNITSYMSGLGCGSAVSTGNTAPVVRADRDYTIPAGVFFELRTLSVADAEGDPVTLTWDQRDSGGTTGFSLSAGDPGRGPIIRSRLGSTATTRTIPPLANILNNTWTTVPGEILPATNRTLAFRVVARDGRGGVGSDDLRLLIRTTATPFRVTAPNSAGTRSGPATITWDVGGTSGSPFGLLSVNIRLSTDGGSTFPITLAQNVPNTGSALVYLPNLTTNRARVRIEPVGSIIFDVSDTDFALAAPTCPTDYNADGVRNLDDLGDFITDFYTLPAIPGGLQPAAPALTDRSVGYGSACGDAPDAPAPYGLDDYRRFGYRVAFSPDGANACVPTGTNLDQLADFITAFYAPDATCAQ